MVRVVKPGRWVLLKHVIDEGEHEGYVGLHDWNFRIEDGRFVIWNRGAGSTLTSASLRPPASSPSWWTRRATPGSGSGSAAGRTS